MGRYAFEWLVVLGAMAVGCGGSVSGSGGTAGSGGGGTAGSSATDAGPPAAGAMTIHISASSNPPVGTKCNIPAHDAQIGATPPSATSPGTRVENGIDGAVVQCSVSGTFNVSGTLRKGTVLLQASGSVTKTSGTATITSFDPTSSVTLTSPANAPCTVTPIEIASGRVWAHFDCPGFVDPDSPTTYCHGAGYFVFEHCEH